MFSVGFQLLHAVFAVESFLKKLQDRGCRFHVIFFDNQAHLCAPPTTRQCVTYKYEMTRVILVRHLVRFGQQTDGQDDATSAFSFPSIDSEQFHQHLAQYPAAFLLCHDGRTGSGALTTKSAASHYMIHQFLRLRHSVALISGTEFNSSRVCMTADGSPKRFWKWNYVLTS